MGYLILMICFPDAICDGSFFNECFSQENGNWSVCVSIPNNDLLALACFFSYLQATSFANVLTPSPSPCIVHSFVLLKFIDDLERMKSSSEFLSLSLRIMREGPWSSWVELFFMIIVGLRLAHLIFCFFSASPNRKYMFSYVSAKLLANESWSSDQITSHSSWKTSDNVQLAVADKWAACGVGKSPLCCAYYTAHNRFNNRNFPSNNSYQNIANPINCILYAFYLADYFVVVVVLEPVGIKLHGTRTTIWHKPILLHPFTCRARAHSSTHA